MTELELCEKCIWNDICQRKHGAIGTPECFIRKCDLCSSKADFCESPIGNPDEQALCKEHYLEYKNTMLQGKK